MPRLNMMSLNVGRMLQTRTRNYLKELNDFATSVPDVLCLQDIPLSALSLLERWPHVTFGPMTNHLINGVRGVVGIAIASRHFMTDITHHTVWGDGKLKDLQGINEQNQRHLGAESDELVEATEDRLVICASVIKDGRKFNIATTHGMWVRGGVTNDVQRKCMQLLRDVLVDETSIRGGLTLMADMNFGKGSEIHTMFARRFRDCMPAEIESTLDPEHPFAKRGGKVVTDYVMTGGDSDSVTDVRLRHGMSDHCALFATVSRD